MKTQLILLALICTALCPIPGLARERGASRTRGGDAPAARSGASAFQQTPRPSPTFSGVRADTGSMPSFSRGAANRTPATAHPGFQSRPPVTSVRQQPQMPSAPRVSPERDRTPRDFRTARETTVTTRETTVTTRYPDRNTGTTIRGSDRGGSGSVSVRPPDRPNREGGSTIRNPNREGGSIRNPDRGSGVSVRPPVHRGDSDRRPPTVTHSRKPWDSPGQPRPPTFHPNRPRPPVVNPGRPHHPPPFARPYPKRRPSWHINIGLGYNRWYSGSWYATPWYSGSWYAAPWYTPTIYAPLTTYQPIIIEQQPVVIQEAADYAYPVASEPLIETERVWVEGYWQLEKDDEGTITGRVWIPGHWEDRPVSLLEEPQEEVVERVWVEGYWSFKKDDEGFITGRAWVPGHWENRTAEAGEEGI